MQESKLEQALELLGYENAKELHHKSNLIHAIELFAGVTDNPILESDCQLKIQHIRVEVEAKQQRR